MTSGRIRSATIEDVDAILEIYAPIVAETIISFETEVPTRDEMGTRLEKSHLWLVGEDEAGISGYAYAGPFNVRAAYQWSAEVSVYVHAERVGQGVGRSLVAELLDRLTEKGFVNAFAGVALPNDASVRLFESFGFRQMALQKEVGFKLGRWIDVAWWQKRLRDPSVPPPELAVP